MIKAIYLDCKGKEYKKLSKEEKEFLKDLYYQCKVMDDFNKPLSRSEIKTLCETCNNDIQLEIALRPRKAA